MCFSATASFTLGSLLVPIGIFCVAIAYKANKNFIFLAIIPIIFGMQQYTEGIIWMQLGANNLSAAHLYTYIYLFFALYFWPAYLPICAYYIEKEIVRKKMMRVFVIMGQAVGIIIYAQVLLGYLSSKVMIVNQTLNYEVYHLDMLGWTYSTSYVLIMILPLVFSSAFRIKIFGILLLISSMVSYGWYIYAFTSVWCFFAAILSIYIAYIIYNLPSGSEEKNKR